MSLPHWPMPFHRTKTLVALLAAVVIPALVVVATGAAAEGNSGGPSGRGDNGHGRELSTILSGTTLGISQPDDVTLMDGQVFVAFQNGVGPQGQASASGALDSTVVEMTPSGVVESKWNLAGHCDGLTADPQAGELLATVNEDANSSLYTIDPSIPTPVQYAYSPSALPHNGGTDAISVMDGQILVSASAPGTSGAPAPQPTYPAVYAVSLDASTRTATVNPVFSDESTAQIANVGPTEGQSATLGLTDPDSNEVVPPQSPRFGGDLILDSQGDQQQIYVHDPGRPDQSLSLLNLTQSINDSAWVTSGDGTLYVTDHTDNLVDVLRGHFDPGTVFVAVTPCDAQSAAASCAANSLGTLDLSTGIVSSVDLGGEMVQPQGLAFDQGHDSQDQRWGGNQG